MRFLAASPFVLACLLAVSGARAQAAGSAAKDAPITPQLELRHDLIVDGVATGVMAASLVSWRLLEADIVAGSCTICDGDQPGETNALDELFRDALRRRDGTPAGTASHLLAYGGGPLMGVALTIGVAAADHRINEAPLNTLLVVEASLAAVLVKEAVTAVVRRERPEVHALSGETKSAALASADSLESFPGGHTASVMAITASAATIATLRGYRLAPLVWIVGSLLGVTSTYLRIAADQSYVTDELAGAFIGLGVGAGVPLLFHKRLGERPSAATGWLRGALVTSRAVRGGRVVGLGWSF